MYKRIAIGDLSEESLDLTITEPTSLNNKLVVEAYKKEGLRAEVKSGFSHLSQKISSKGLKLLVTARLNDGTVIPKGSTVYVREELLHTQPWATKALESDSIEGQFLVIDLNYVDYVVPPKVPEAKKSSDMSDEEFLKSL